MQSDSCPGQVVIKPVTERLIVDWAWFNVCTNTI